MGFNDAPGRHRINDQEKAHEMAKAQDKARDEGIENHSREGLFAGINYEMENLSKKTDKELYDILGLVRVELSRRNLE